MSWHETVPPALLDKPARGLTMSWHETVPPALLDKPARGLTLERGLTFLSGRGTPRRAAARPRGAPRRRPTWSPSPRRRSRHAPSGGAVPPQSAVATGVRARLP